VSRFQATLLALAAVGLLAAPMAALAQEEEADPPVLRLSFFMCDFRGDNGEAVEEELTTRVIPVWNALVDEGRVEQYGYFYHWWADEWNVGIYTLAESIQAIIDAEEEAGNRLEAQYGDGPSPFFEACPHHRDGFYTMGPNTGMDRAAGGS